VRQQPRRHGLTTLSHMLMKPKVASTPSSADHPGKKKEAACELIALSLSSQHENF
jgi:hypothetical protein